MTVLFVERQVGFGVRRSRQKVQNSRAIGRQRDDGPDPAGDFVFGGAAQIPELARERAGLIVPDGFGNQGVLCAVSR
jgi:hypothetical protein